MQGSGLKVQGSGCRVQACACACATASACSCAWCGYLGSQGMQGRKVMSTQFQVKQRQCGSWGLQCSTEGPSWGHSKAVLGAISSFLEPLCGHLSPKNDKVSEELTFAIPPRRALRGSWGLQRFRPASRILTTNGSLHARLFVGVSQSQFFRDLVNFWR